MDIELIKKHLNDVLTETDFKHLGQKKAGKVRDIYTEPHQIILITTDRLTGFDRVLANIPFKGEVLNQISNFWFEQTRDIIPNHVVAVPDPNVTVGKKCAPLKIEGVVRGYLTGVTDTSIWTRYSKGIRTFGSVVLPDSMKKNQKLPQAIFDPTTKEDLHDRTLTKDEMIAEGFITKELFDQVEKYSLALFARGQEIALQRGLILVDTKYEFGIDEFGNLILIDEIHTPDSSRYWKAGSYDERFNAGQEPEYFDKEFIRLWFKEHSDPYKDAVLPEAPADLIAELSRRYIEIYETITGKTFEHDFNTPVLERIKKNLE
ncbi:MAG: phosphoribosylaminoimidazolesuccinocarboxamide synthase [Patescibacteria group bacterium]